MGGADQEGHPAAEMGHQEDRRYSSIARRSEKNSHSLHSKNQPFSLFLCKRQRQNQLDGWRWVCVAAVSKRVESEVRSIEAALEGQRAALALEMALEKQALSNDTSGADEVHDACLVR